MAGITNVAYRSVCREFGSPTALYVCEMITARAVVERDPTTLQMITFGADEHPRSLQLYSVDPTTMREAVHIIASENLADHTDVNFGWPVKKTIHASPPPPRRVRHSSSSLFRSGSSAPHHIPPRHGSPRPPATSSWTSRTPTAGHDS
jgi:hypothetical protein